MRELDGRALAQAAEAARSRHIDELTAIELAVRVVRAYLDVLPTEPAIEGGWQPIASAPVNPPGKFHGPSVLLWCAASETTVEGYFGQVASGDGGYLATEDGREISAATHWRPRLAPPIEPPAEETVQGREVEG